MYLKIIISAIIAILGLILSIPQIDSIWMNVLRIVFIILAILSVLIEIRTEKANADQARRRDKNLEKIIINTVDEVRIKKLMIESIGKNNSLKSTPGWWKVRPEDVGKKIEGIFLRINVDNVFKYSFIIMINDEKLELNNNIVFVPAISSKGEHAFLSLVVYPTWWEEKTPVKIYYKHKSGHHTIQESILENHFFPINQHDFQWWDLDSLKTEKTVDIPYKKV